MKHWKRILALLLAILMVFALAACDNDSGRKDRDDDDDDRGGSHLGDLFGNEGNGEGGEDDPDVGGDITPDVGGENPSIDPIFQLSDEEILKTITYDTTSTRGTCGNDLRWCYKDGILVITGTGKMDWTYGRTKDFSPWRERQLDPRRLVVDEGATTIGKFAFYEITSLEMISLPESLEEVGSNAFCGTGLKEVDISVKNHISGNAFHNCTALEQFTLRGTAQSVGSETFMGCTSLKSVNLPESLTRIADGAFSGCTALESISIPTGVQRIENFAFKDCTALKEISLPAATTELWQGAFTGCTGLEKVTMPGMITIGMASFYNCHALKNITLPETVTSIEDEAFAYCTSLRKLDIPLNAEFALRSFHHSGLETFTMDENDVQEPILEGCVNLKVFKFDTNTTEIFNPHSMFTGCTNLQEVYIPAGVEYDASMLLKDCPKAEIIIF